MSARRTRAAECSDRPSSGIRLAGCTSGSLCEAVFRYGGDAHLGRWRPRIMKTSHLALLLLVTLSAACATTTTTTTTWTDPAAAGYGRAGTVEAVQEIVQRTQGNPAAGAVAGGLIGGLLFGGGRGPAAVAGALGGAAIGAAASQGATEQRTYEVIVRFDDGGYGEFVYAGYSPFRPAERVVVTPGGLARAG